MALSKQDQANAAHVLAELKTDRNQLLEIGSAFSGFVNDNIEVLKNKYLDFLNENKAGIKEEQVSFPHFCFSIFIIEIAPL